MIPKGVKNYDLVKLAFFVLVYVQEKVTSPLQVLTCVAVQSEFIASSLRSSRIEQELFCVVSEPLFLLLKLFCLREKHTLISNLVCEWMGKEELFPGSMSLPP